MMLLNNSESYDLTMKWYNALSNFLNEADPRKLRFYGLIGKCLLKMNKQHYLACNYLKKYSYVNGACLLDALETLDT